MTQSSQAYTRARRIRRRADFVLTLRSKGSAKSDYFRLYSRPSPSRDSRLGIVITKRVERTAVGRNAVKRLIRETFRREAAREPALDLVVRVEKSIPTRCRPAAASALTAMFRAALKDASRQRDG